MDEATVKEIFRQKLNQILTPDLLADSDIVDVTLLVGYRMYLQKCDNSEAIRILSEATSDNESIVNALVDYFNQFTTQQKKIQQEKEESIKKQQDAKNQQNNTKKQDTNNKSRGKIPPKPKPKVETKAQGQIEGDVKMPPVQKKPKLQNGQQQTQGAKQQQQGQTPAISIATQLINQGKVKCKYFPFCKNQQCQYFHPTEKCQYFPRCKFGQACMCVHQACKYGENCTRNNCFYDHPFKKKSDNPMLEFMKLAMGQMKNKRPIRKRKPTEDAAQIEKPNQKPVGQQQQK